MQQESRILAYRINDAADALGISRSLIYKEIGFGRLRAIKIAGRTLIPRSEIERLLQGVTADA